MTLSTEAPFSREEAIGLWSRLVAGWANTLDDSGTRTLMDGLPNSADAGGSYEGVTRMLWGLGSWLAYPERPAVLRWRGVDYDLEALTRRALLNGCDRAIPSSWHNVLGDDRDQRTVESGQIAFATWQTRERIWAGLNEAERANISEFLDEVGQPPDRWSNNWALFWLLNHAGRKALALPYDQEIIDDVLLDYLDLAYAGEGWYNDAAERGPNRFDHYNTWVFASHVLAWAEMDGASLPERRDVLLERVREWMQHYPDFFAANGATVEFGRSLSYKFARLGAPLWAYKLGVWPHSAGMLRRLVGKHLRWYVERGALRADGTLRQTLTEAGSPEIVERYISTGAPYWAMQAFSGLWSLRDDDPFWTAEEEALPSEQGDYTRVFAVPGWVLSARGREVELYRASAVRSGYGNKYAKFVYGTQNPFNAGLDAGQPSLDSNLCLSEGGIRGQRESVERYAVGEPGWLRARYPIQVGEHVHLVDTTIVLLGDVHIRAHRITLDPAATQVTAEEGSAALGYDAGMLPRFRTSGPWLLLSYSGNYVGLRAVRGYSAAPRSVTSGSNSVYGQHVVTVLRATLGSVTGAASAGAATQNLGVVLTPAPASRQHELICAVYAGNGFEEERLPGIEQMDWDFAGRFGIRVNGAILVIPPLPE